MRVTTEDFPSLFELPSTCKAISSRDLPSSTNPSDYTVHMDLGLFSPLDFYENKYLLVFVQTLSTRELSLHTIVSKIKPCMSK